MESRGPLELEILDVAGGEDDAEEWDGSTPSFILDGSLSSLSLNTTSSSHDSLSQQSKPEETDSGIPTR